MTFSSIQNGFSAGEISPRLFGRTDLQKYHLGCSTLRNFYVDYRGGASSRAGLAYVGMCKQAAPNDGGTATDNPPRDIPFQFNISQGYALEFGDQYMRIKSDGAYVVETGKNITSATQADPAVLTIVGHSYSVDDWVFIQDMAGMTEFNGLTWVVASTPDADSVTLTDLFGAAVDSTNFTAYTSGGTSSRIYTVAAPYAAVDLPFLKYTQSADTMTLTCVNQETSTEYPSYELVRNGATNWAFTADTFASSIAAPTGIAVAANPSTTLSTFYSYVVTAVDAATGEESVASPVGTVENNDIAINAGSNVITFSTVVGVSTYNIYAATASYAVSVPVGASFGYIGSSFGNQFTDTNIIADFTTVPPVHNDPFARGKIASVTATAVGYSYTQSGVTYNISTSTGSGAVITPVVVNGGVVAYIVTNGGKNYANTDTITITANGHKATATLNIGPQTGTFPGDCAYFQQRRGYAFTLNQPDTYWFSQPGAFNNMDASIPATDSDSITGSPWAQQINGIQFMVPMNPGLMMLTGGGAWLLNGGTSSAFTPSDQTAAPQSYNGCHFHIQPIVINLDILYVQAKGSIVRDLSFNFFQNIFTGVDLTVLSEHLFNFHQLQQWAYAEEPFKVAWIVRDDGTLLCLTYLKEQDVYGWSRHDTNGLFVSVCSITEPPVDAIYTITKRYIQGPQQWAYYSERMDNRNWQNVENCFCVDAGLSLSMTFPNATLMPLSTTGTNQISNINLIYGGTGYTAPTIRAVDPTEIGSGFAATPTVIAGVITGFSIDDPGQNYQPGTQLEISDSTGIGATMAPIITNNTRFTASAGVFTANNVGDVIRIGNNNASPLNGFSIASNGGGKAIITSYVAADEVVANIIEPITNTITDDPFNTPAPVSPNYWSISTPVSSIGGLNHLEGMEVAILADGSVLTPQTVVDGSITLPAPYSAVTVGLPYTCQLQTLYLDAPSQSTMQGKRKNIQAVTVRVQDTRGISVGTNQKDASTQASGRAPVWTKMHEMKQRNATQAPGTAIPLATGDLRELVSGDWSKPGQVAIQITDPLPGNILAIIPEFSVGDNNG